MICLLQWKYMVQLGMELMRFFPSNSTTTHNKLNFPRCSISKAGAFWHPIMPVLICLQKAQAVTAALPSAHSLIHWVFLTQTLIFSKYVGVEWPLRLILLFQIWTKLANNSKASRSWRMGMEWEWKKEVDRQLELHLIP